MAWRKKRIVSPQGWCGGHLPYGVQRKALLPQECSSRSCSQGGRRGNFHSWMKQMSLPNGGAAQGAAPMESSARRCSHGSPAQGAAPKEEEEEASYPHGRSREATSRWGSSARRCPYGVQLKELLQRKKKRIFPLSWPKHHPLPGGIRRSTMLPITRFLPAAI